MRQAIEGMPNVELIGDIADRDGMEGLYERADVVLSLHRAEGLGLVIAEAMLRGIAVVATNWSGSTDFLTCETGVPIAYRLIPIDDPQGQYPAEAGCWADPDIEAASRALQRLRDDPDWRHALAEEGCARAKHAFAVERYAREIQELLVR
jgi:glycosyltransferase involved in cell wall biosynthesis